MKFRCKFIVESDVLEEIVKNAKNLSEKELIMRLGKNNGIQKFNEETDRYRILLKLAAVGLFENGFSEEEAFKILEGLLSLDQQCFSPGNLKDKQ